MKHIVFTLRTQLGAWLMRPYLSCMMTHYAGHMKDEEPRGTHCSYIYIGLHYALRPRLEHKAVR